MNARLLIRFRNQVFRFLDLAVAPRDGSMSVILRRNTEAQQSYRWSETPDGRTTPQSVEIPASKGRRITIHQSGRINYHHIGKVIFVEPIVSLDVV